MLPQKIESLVISVLKEVQEMSGREWNGLAMDATPIGDLDGFDSISGVEATVMIEQQLGCEFGLDSVFISDDGKRALTTMEIAERLETLVKSAGGQR